MTSKQIILDALNYYDKNKELFSLFLANVKYVSFIPNENDLVHNSIVFYDENKKVILKSRIEILGSFNNFSRTWIWAWSNPNNHKNLVYTSKKILNYGLDIVPTIETKFLKAELITSRFRISDIVQLDIHIAIASYISKLPLVFNFYEFPEIIIAEPEFKQNIPGIYKILKPKYDDDVYAIISFFILDYDKIITH